MRMGIIGGRSDRSIARRDTAIACRGGRAHCRRCRHCSGPAARLHLGVSWAEDAERLLHNDVDGLVIATPTDTHAALISAAVKAGIAIFCEKPVATDVAGTRDVVRQVEKSGAQVQVGFQRRFDVGFVSAREQVQARKLGWLHTIRAGTLDPAPPPASYIASSGGIFRDCSVHDIDAVRWVTGQDVRKVYATGSNRGANYFLQAGDVDTAAALLTLEDDTLAFISATRYNAAGYDVRLELLGSQGSISVGLDDRLPLRSAEPGVTWPAGTAYAVFWTGSAMPTLPSCRLLSIWWAGGSPIRVLRPTPWRPSMSLRHVSCLVERTVQSPLRKYDYELNTHCRRSHLLGRVRGPRMGLSATRERVLGEMAELGVVATEFGPDGFLPEDPANVPSCWPPLTAPFGRLRDPGPARPGRRPPAGGQRAWTGW